MSSEPKIFHGEWWVPANADPYKRFFMITPVGHEKHYTGTLTYYEDYDSTLELYHIPSDFHANLDGYNYVMWGVTANGLVFSLFNLSIEEEFSGDFSRTKFTVGLILAGEHLISMRKPHYNRCFVQFPYLRNWAFHDNLVNTRKDGFQNQTILDVRNLVTLAEANVADGIKWILRDKFSCNRSVYDLTVNQLTEFAIETSDAVSIDTFLKHIGEFSQFLSIALYCEQSPTEIRLYGIGQIHSVQLLYKIDRSIDPKANKLIKFDALKEKVSTMLLVWHQNYDKIAPISSYLVDSLQKKKTFGVPDFLIIAQALDGYHKRFVNKSKGKDKRKYDEQIEVLLNQFDDVEVIQRCHIDPKVLRDTRHKYSHLFPDDEKSLAVDGDELYWLTEKCKILLTCCILNMMGLSNAEINLCCENSPITAMIKSNPFEFE